MIFKEMKFKSITNFEDRTLTILVTGEKPSLMINESFQHIIEGHEDTFEFETVQLDSEEVLSLYQVLHKIYSSKD